MQNSRFPIFFFILFVLLSVRPFERTLTLHKDSSGHLGFQFKEGKITAIAINTSASRNGMLVNHNLLEVRRRRKSDCEKFEGKKED